DDDVAVRRQGDVTCGVVRSVEVELLDAVAVESGGRGTVALGERQHVEVRAGVAVGVVGPRPCGNVNTVTRLVDRDRGAVVVRVPAQIDCDDAGGSPRR